MDVGVCLPFDVISYTAQNLEGVIMLKYKKLKLIIRTSIHVCYFADVLYMVTTLYICITTSVLGNSDFRIVDFLYTQDDITYMSNVQIDSGTYNI